ncbi:MAG: sulfur carrier protein ThiS [Acidobacteria bacterium]|nr:sulfur carrier protein ThiS [Acidobacteriota bacterium]
MKVMINDREQTVACDTTVVDILRARRLEPGQTLVELNGRIVQPEDFEDVQPQDGDELKVHTIVCGG